MADSTTAHYGLIKPDNSASNDTWGIKGNTNLDSLDNLIFNLRSDITTLQGQITANSAAITANKSIYDTYVAAHTFPSGAIGIWKGSVASIPDGWLLCDGNNGTPNLKDLFVLGAGNAYAPGDVGGSNTRTPVVTVNGTAITIAQMPSHNHGYSDPGHSHSVYDGGHSHTYVHSNISNAGGFNAGSGGNQGGYGDNTGGSNANVAIAPNSIGISISNNGGSQTHTATGTPMDIRPPYMALCYIMKI